jgi:hypothetical protein
VSCKICSKARCEVSSSVDMGYKIVSVIGNSRIDLPYRQNQNCMIDVNPLNNYLIIRRSWDCLCDSLQNIDILSSPDT